MSADKSGITVRQLLTHTSGIVDVPEGVEDYTPISQRSMVSKLLAAPLTFAPGERQEYSNGGYALLAAIVASASGCDFFEYLEKEVFRRAGVTASYDPASLPVQDVAQSKINGSWEDVRRLAAASHGPFWGVWGAGSLFMPAMDLARLTDAFLAGRIVEPSLVRLALRPVSSLRPGVDRALGFLVYRTRRGTKLLYHNGWGEYFNADLRHYPEQGLTIAVLSTSRVPNALRAGREMAEALLGPDQNPPSRPQISGHAVAPGDQDWRLVDELLAAAEHESERPAFVHSRMTKRLIAEAGDSGLIRTLARANAQLRRPRIVAIRRHGDALTALLESYNMQEVRFYRLEMTTRAGEGRLWIDAVQVVAVPR